MPTGLCRQCSEIPLEPGLKTLCSKGYSGRDTWWLGRVEEVRARNCPFCELVAFICTRKATDSQALTLPPEPYVMVRWNEGFFSSFSFSPGCFICVARDLAHEKIHCARANFDEFIDFDDVRRWLSACDQQHGGLSSRCCPMPFNPAILPRIGKRQIELRVIDVQTMCIVYAPLRCKYLALSYVWGQRREAQVVLTTHNEETMMRPGALSDARLSIPNTIMDAITVVSKLGERYLWVDSLCLAQDDAGELDACVALMDLFYEMAILTIVAADGADAWAGLQGVEPTSRKVHRQVREISPGLSMAAVVEMDGILRSSIYSTRAWTMQEEAISPRILVFVNGQVYYRCASSCYTEEFNWPGKPLHDQGSLAVSAYSRAFTRNGPTDFRGYLDMLRDYKLRKLSNQSDILRAAQGMLRKFSTLTSLHCFEGLPAPLDRSLLFRNLTPGANLMSGRREGLPSYSWTGWKNESTYADSITYLHGILNDRLTEDRLVEQNLAEDKLIEGKEHLRVWIIWHCRLEDGEIFRITDSGRLQKPLSLKFEDNTRNARWLSRKLPVEATAIQFEAPRINPYPLLFFWTICVDLSFEQEAATRQNPQRLPGCAVINRYAEYCGEIAMDTSVPGRIDGIFALLAADSGAFWALLLVWKDGIAERRGVAHLFESVIDTCLPPGPRWKEIVLG